MAQNSPALVLGTNSFIKFADAQVYFSGRFGVADWLALSGDDQYRALITASHKINFMLKDEFKLGTITTYSDQLKNATCEMALYLASDSANSDLANTGSNIKSIVADTVKLEYFSPVSGTKFPQMVMDFLIDGELMDSVIGSGGGMIASGTDGLSSFDSCDSLTVSSGLGS
ncbi:MAG: hypothetical protein OEY89_16670 [Gammaproteobacteria bacterium]|nr:hypothetical protein [Gammaproteobacteria bacterium]